MNHEAVKARLKEKLNEAPNPTIIWSQPGAGKLQLIKSIALETQIHLQMVQLSLFTDLAKLEPTSKNGILFLDELNLANSKMQYDVTTLLIENKLPTWHIWAGGTHHGTVVDTLHPILSVRFEHLTLN